MQFEWDEEKANRNLKKHGIHFEDAAFVFADQNRIERFDDRENYGEDRFNTIGLVFGVLICVCYTMRNDAVRIISARKAYGNEKTAYYQNQY